jgi:hypothetical protein
MSSFANYVQAACRCRRGWMCNFCRKYLNPTNTHKKEAQP